MCVMNAMSAWLVALLAPSNLTAFCLPALPLPCMCRAVMGDGLSCEVPTAHSVLLCFMFGPLGLLSHVLTRWLVRRQMAFGGL